MFFAGALLLVVLGVFLLFSLSGPGAQDGEEGDAFDAQGRIWNPKDTPSESDMDQGGDAGGLAVVNSPLSQGKQAKPARPRSEPASKDEDRGSSNTSAQAQPVRSVPTRPGEEEEGAEKPASLGKAEIKEVISKMKPRVKTCYEETLKTFPEADGDIKLSFTIVASDGKSHIDLEEVSPESTLFDTQLHQCLLDALREQEFPLPDVEDGIVRVNYPFHFNKDDEETK